MKKVLLIWLLAAGFASAGATAQNIALGERVPELKIQTWLDNRQPEPARRPTSNFSIRRIPRAKPRSNA